MTLKTPNCYQAKITNVGCPTPAVWARRRTLPPCPVDRMRTVHRPPNTLHRIELSPVGSPVSPLLNPTMVAGPNIENSISLPDVGTMLPFSSVKLISTGTTQSGSARNGLLESLSNLRYLTAPVVCTESLPHDLPFTLRPTASSFPFAYGTVHSACPLAGTGFLPRLAPFRDSSTSSAFE